MSAKLLNTLLVLVVAFWILFVLGIFLFPLLFSGIFIALIVLGIILSVGVALYYLMKPTPPVSNRNPKIKMKQIK